MPSPFDNTLGDFFGVADKEGFVAIIHEHEDETKLAISLDDGINWEIRPVDVPEGFRASSLCFYSTEEGYLTLSNYDSKENYLVKIEVDNEIIDNKSVIEIPSTSLSISFANAQVGWVSCWEAMHEFPFSKMTLLQTADGGQSWNPVVFELTEDMEANLVEVSAEVPQWKNDRWECQVVFVWWGQFLGDAEYTFVYDNQTGTWSWNEPDWQVSEEINKVRLMEYLWCVELPEAEFSSENPTEDNIKFVSQVPMCQTSDYLKRIGQWSLEYVEEQPEKNDEEWVSPDILGQIQQQFYGILPQELDLTGWGEGTYSELGLKVHYYHAHGFVYPHREIRKVTMLNDTDFQVDMDVYTPINTDAPNEFPKLEQSIRCVFRLQPVERAQIFTLLSQTVTG